MLSGWLHNIFNYNENENENENEATVKHLNKKVKDLYNPCVLAQGQRLHAKQAEKVEALQPNLLAFNENVISPYANTSPYVNVNTYARYGSANVNTYANGDRYSNANTYATTNTYIKGRKYPPGDQCGNSVEGFETLATPRTNAKNSSELAETNNASANYGQKIDRYVTEYPSLLADSRMYVQGQGTGAQGQGTDRTKNIKATLNQAIGVNYDITADKEGCYKQTDSVLDYQSDMTNVTVDTCKNRASEIGYAGFSIKKKTDGQLGCYLTNDLAGAKSGGLATKSQTSLAFKSDKNANLGSLLMNGQLGLFQDTLPLATDLTAVPGCDMKGGKILINTDSVVATYGSNCLNSIKSAYNNKCIDQNQGSTASGLQMQMWDCVPGHPHQNMKYNQTTQTINAPGNNLCVDVWNRGTGNGTKVSQYSCTGGSNQKWVYGADKTLRPQHTTGKCLDLLNNNNANGAGLGIWDCNGGANQQWDITQNGNILAP